METVRRHIDAHVCVCRRCGGTGRTDAGNGRTAACPQCNGSGRVVIESDITTYVSPYRVK